MFISLHWQSQGAADGSVTKFKKRERERRGKERNDPFIAKEHFFKAAPANYHGTWGPEASAAWAPALSATACPLMASSNAWITGHEDRQIGKLQRAAASEPLEDSPGRTRQSRQGRYPFPIVLSGCRITQLNEGISPTWVPTWERLIDRFLSGLRQVESGALFKSFVWDRERKGRRRGSLII